MKNTYYKTTRMDGGSWYKPEFIYKEGEIYNIDLQNHTKTYPICSRYVLHACNTPEKAASYSWGVKWPFRLWSFEGNSVIRKNDKFGFRQIGPMQEEDRTLCFGPNGIAVMKMLKILETINTQQLQNLATTQSISFDAQFTAWNTIWDIAKDTTRWSAWDAAWNATTTAIRHKNPNVNRSITWDIAKDIVRVLVIADLVGQHGLEQHHIDTLMAPWISIFGEDWMKDKE